MRGFTSSYLSVGKIVLPLFEILKGALALFCVKIQGSLLLPPSLEKLGHNADIPLVFYSTIGDYDNLKRLAIEAVSLGYKNVKIYPGGIKRWLKDGYYLVTTIEYVEAAFKEGKPLVFVDTRPLEVAKDGHIPGAVNITPEGITQEVIMPYEAGDPVVIYGENEDDRTAHRVALMIANLSYYLKSNSPVMVLKEGFRGWNSKNLPVEKSAMERIIRAVPKSIKVTGMILFDEFKKKWAKRKNAKDFIFLDVRSEKEFLVQPYDDVIHIPIDELPYLIPDIPKGKEIIACCSSGFRAKIAYYILKNNGYKVRYLNRIPY